MDPRIPLILQPLLQEYTNILNQELPGRISAFYLEGSIALVGFNPRLSDIDFVAILSSPAEKDDFEKLRDIHKMIERKYSKWKLSGMYFQQRDLGCLDHEVEPHLNYHDGKLKWSDRFGLSAVTWWILKNHGIAIIGPPPQTLTYTVNMDYLIQTQRENLNSYWASWTTRPDGILALLSDWGIQWTVLGVLRQFYTFHERQITSKVKAGEYALNCVPERWHCIIREAIALREEPKQTYYRSKMKRAFEAFRFLKYTIQSCNDYLDASIKEKLAGNDHIQAHKHCIFHRVEIQSSEICGCFYCLKLFKPQAIKEWVDERAGTGQTALCPMCGIDSVIGSSSGYPIKEDFLKKMHEYWF